MNNSMTMPSSPTASGGGGHSFEAQVQASFVALMLTGGFAPALPCWPISEIKLQGKVAGYNTDDLIVFVHNPERDETRRFLGNVKSSVVFQKSNKRLAEVFQAAWRDYNNPSVLTKNKDIIVLITDHLREPDYKAITWILEQARHTKDSQEFFLQVIRANFAPTNADKKFAVIKHHLKLANCGCDVPDEDIYQFLRHFHVLVYDLKTTSSVVRYLLYSLVSRFNCGMPERIFSRLIDVVQSYNKSAGTITPENLPDDITNAFQQKSAAIIPSGYVRLDSPDIVVDNWSRHGKAPSLVIATMIGAWSDNHPADSEAIKALIHETKTVADYDTWVRDLRDIQQEADSPLLLVNGIWEVKHRTCLWDALENQLFDSHLVVIQSFSIKVLSEIDPRFELPEEKRYAASIYDKVLKHSPNIRQAAAETLTLLGCNSKGLPNCSTDKARQVSHVAVRQLLESRDWQLWASLDSQFPVLSEASPNVFLGAIESALNTEPCLFDTLFEQEGDGIFGSNYLTGLLRALEGLAWSKEHFSRVVVILAQLATHDPGGRWTNRPANSLITILLPWMPQTMVPVEKRVAALQAVNRDYPDIAWQTLLGLLPQQGQSSSGSHKPRYRQYIPVEWDEEVSHEEYRQQVDAYAEMVVDMAIKDVTKLSNLVKNLNKLPDSSFDIILQHLGSDIVIKLPEKERLPLWESLTAFVVENRRYCGAKWVLSEQQVDQIDDVARLLTPKSPAAKYKRLFTRSHLSLCEEKDHWEEQLGKLEQKRQAAVQEIIDESGLSGIISLIDFVESPGRLGGSLGSVANADTDKNLLPEIFNRSASNNTEFIKSYIVGRLQHKGVKWIDTIDRAGWKNEYTCRFLTCLPFEDDTWNRAECWLGASVDDYWKVVPVEPYRSRTNLNRAIEKLLEVSRPCQAITCLYVQFHQKLTLNIDLLVRALTAVVNFEDTGTIDFSNISHEIVELIKYLQSCDDVSSDDLSRIEWAYLPMLDDIHGARPQLLYHRLASEPQFFCDIIKIMYRSDQEEPKEKISESRSVNVKNAWLLLHHWNRPPGTMRDDKFSDRLFEQWVNAVEAPTRESGHYQAAMTEAGKVLFYSPPDASGLWINHTVAEVLDKASAADMRHGFQLKGYSQDFHKIDPAGKPEKALAAEWNER